MNYKKLYRLQDGKLIRNTENKILYTDDSGIKRVKTNPDLKDFIKVGIKPLIKCEIPEYDIEKEYLEEKITDGSDNFTMEYKIKEIESI